MPKTATPRKPRTLAGMLAETRRGSRNRGLAELIGDNERQLLADLASGANDVLGRGTLAGLVGAPGDIAGLSENAVRYLLGKPQVEAWGGSEHIGRKLEEAGLVSAERRAINDVAKYWSGNAHGRAFYSKDLL